MSAAICAPNVPNCRVTNAAWSCCLAVRHLWRLCSIASRAYATTLAVCNNQRIPRATKSLKGVPSGVSRRWAGFYGFKLHAIINSKGELLRLKLTPGNVDDRKPMPELCQGLVGQRFADKGNIISRNGSPKY
jgi:hypothetical protein